MLTKAGTFGVLGDEVCHLLQVIHRELVVFDEFPRHIPWILVEIIGKLERRLAFFDIDVEYVVVFRAV